MIPNVSKMDWVKDTLPNRIRFSKICNAVDGFEGFYNWIWVIFGESYDFCTVLRQDRCVGKGI